MKRLLFVALCAAFAVNLMAGTADAKLPDRTIRVTFTPFFEHPDAVTVRIYKPDHKSSQLLRCVRPAYAFGMTRNAFTNDRLETYTYTGNACTSPTGTRKVKVTVVGYSAVYVKVWSHDGRSMTRWETHAAVAHYTYNWSTGAIAHVWRESNFHQT